MGESEASEGFPSPESKIERWGSTTRFKDYLYRIAVLGNEGAETIAKFPQGIELDDDWHGMINLMRKESRDGFERSTIAGFQKDARRIYLPKKFEKGTFWESSDPKLSAIQESHGILLPAVPIHSHPGGWFERLISKAAVVTKMAKGMEGFSPDDLYNILEGTSLPIQAVVEKNHTYFVFRTLETNELLSDTPLPRREEFEKYWLQQIGVYPILEKKLGVVLSLSYDLEKMNNGIASAYSLVLYKGKPNEDLHRISPLSFANLETGTNSGRGSS